MNIFQRIFILMLLLFGLVNISNSQDIKSYSWDYHKIADQQLGNPGSIIGELGGYIHKWHPKRYKNVKYIKIYKSKPWSVENMGFEMSLEEKKNFSTNFTGETQEIVGNSNNINAQEMIKLLTEKIRILPSTKVPTLVGDTEKIFRKEKTKLKTYIDRNNFNEFAKKHQDVKLAEIPIDNLVETGGKIIFHDKIVKSLESGSSYLYRNLAYTSKDDSKTLVLWSDFSPIIASD